MEVRTEEGNQNCEGRDGNTGPVRSRAKDEHLRTVPAGGRNTNEQWLAPRHLNERLER